MRFPTLPENLYDRPTLVWTLGNEGAAAHRVEASYLTGNLAWSADYVLTVDRNDSIADLDGWVTLKNESGTAFTNASLQFVAGDLNRVRQDYARRPEMPQAVGGAVRVGIPAGSLSPSITCTASTGARRSRTTRRNS